MNGIRKLPTEVQDGLSIVEERLREVAQSKRGSLRDITLATVMAGGKRIRPLLVFVAGLTGEYRMESLAEAAVAVELIHMATLIHDDVLDEAESRRGLPTVRRVYSDRMALVCGDSLFATAFAILAGLEDTRLIDVAAEAAIALSEGEMIQMRCAGDEACTVEDYFNVIDGKTAALFSSACRLGGIIGGSGAEVLECLGEYGYRLGRSFQIWDDVLDVSGLQDETGKAIGKDLQDGTMTLPVILALECDDSGRLSALVSGGNLVGDELEEALGLVMRTEAVSTASEIARHEVELARRAIRGLAAAPARLFNKIADQVVERSA